MSNIKEISSSADDDREKALNDLFGNAPLESDVFVELPSKGKFYKNSGPVKVKTIKYEDEYRILTLKNHNVNPIDKILESCIEGVSLGELFPPDKLFLLLKVREISYGKDYRFSLVCNHCNETVESSMDFSQFPIKEITDDFQDIQEVTLPILKVKAKIKHPRVRDDIYRNNEEDLSKNLFRFILSLGKIEDSVVISKAIKRMHIRDIKTLIKAIYTLDFGVDTSFMFKCPHCGHAEVMEVPLTPSFFSVS